MIKELAKFLGIEASDEFCQKVAIAVGFANMKTGVKHREFPKHIEAEKDVVIYRKGEFFPVLEYALIDFKCSESHKFMIIGTNIEIRFIKPFELLTAT